MSQILIFSGNSASIRPVTEEALMKLGFARHLGLMLGAAVFITQTGCAAFTKAVLREPTVALKAVNVRDINASGATLLFGVEVENPNPVDLKVDALRYDIDVGGKALSSGRLEHPATVPAHGKALVEIPAPIKYSDVFNSLVGFIRAGGSTYRIKGEADFAVFTIPFEREGTFKLSKPGRDEATGVK
jgi:LEA14-like dessication related protein